MTNIVQLKNKYVVVEYGLSIPDHEPTWLVWTVVDGVWDLSGALFARLLASGVFSQWTCRRNQHLT
jgi:hypothetical protein